MTTRALDWPLKGQRVDVLAPNRDGESAVIRTVDGVRAGHLRIAAEGEGTVFIELLEIQSELRGYGLGSETARLVLDAAEAAGYDEVRAWAPPDRGLAVYFWCRMGLRPSFGAGPAGGLSFVRGG